MNWEDAKIILENGGKIRLPHWKKESFWKLSKDGFGRIICHTGFPAKVHLNQLSETTWELWPHRKQTLWDKRIGNPHYYGDAFDIKEVKKFIKDLKGEYKERHNLFDGEDNWINKLAGEKLC